MSTDAGQSLSSLDGLSNILAKICEAQVILTHSVNELVVAQKTTNELIGTLIKDRTASSGKGITAEERRDDTTSGNEKEQNTNHLRHITPDVVLNPVAQVIGTFELLEQILLNDGISMQTLLLSQRVNTTFLAIITKSMPLQRKLFLAPQPNMGLSGVPSLNPLLEKVLGSLPLWFNPETKHITRTAHQATAYHISLQKVKVCEGRKPQHGEGSGAGARPSYVHMLGKICSPEDHAGIVGHGSWERMLLAQPPCASLFTFEKFSPRPIPARAGSRDRSARDFFAPDHRGRWGTGWRSVQKDTPTHEFSLHFSMAKDVGSVGELLRMFAAAEVPRQTSLQDAEIIIGWAIEDGETVRCDTFE
ncbi:hypothetical protein LTR10_009612 [Elasticomyces elasticus]|nr:hypothetical protein LTR10_009612 [Elasticomyces elasticus]KAK4971293.1 hypothetical protein LTR42_007019 [Elasticomyces elasticus]